MSAFSIIICKYYSLDFKIKLFYETIFNKIINLWNLSFVSQDYGVQKLDTEFWWNHKFYK